MSLWTLQTSRTLFEQCVGDAELLDLLSQGPRHLQDVAVAKSRLGENIDARYARVYRVALPSFLGLGYPETGSFPGRHLPSSGENVKLLGTFAFQGATCHLAGKFETTRYLRLKKTKIFTEFFILVSRETLERCSAMYVQVQRTVNRLNRVWDNRRLHLEKQLKPKDAATGARQVSPRPLALFRLSPSLLL